MHQLTPEQRFIEALWSFPQETRVPNSREKGWSKYYKLYEALRGLGSVSLELRGDAKAILNHFGRFMNSPISILKKSEYYLLGINPALDDKKKEDKIRLCKEIRNWSGKDKHTHHAVVDEGWGNAFQCNVLALCNELNINLRDLCSSNLYFCRTKTAAEIRAAVKQKEKLKVFWRVHEAVLEIVEPKFIFVFGKDEFSKIINLMHFGKPKPLLKDYGKKCNCEVAKSNDPSEQLKLIGIPYPSRGRQLTRHPEVLKQIARECR